MITRIRVPVPVPGAVAVLVEAHLPRRVAAAQAAAFDADYWFCLAAGPRQGRARALLASQARVANKVLAAYNPGLRVTLGGAR
ncbi:hypothetical protein [Streptomyces violascens]|uniref:hypothetical protein n=1 Tax=Streptomyces violascens TaxID=67381 RepID=UPI00369D6EAA